MSKPPNPRLAFSRFLILFCAAFSFSAAAQQLAITQRSLPTPNSHPLGILLDPQGALIIDETGTNKIASIGLNGAVSEYNVPTPASSPAYGITGPDGAQWFTESTANNIGRLDPATGVISEFPVPYNGDAALWYMATGSDGALWFTEYNAQQIGRMTTSGVVTEFPIPIDDPGPSGMAAGPDGAIWFTEEDAGLVGRITTDGVITQFPIPSRGSAPLDIVAGPDGAMWFSEHDTHKVGRITTAGVITEFPIPSNGGSGILTVGPDKAIWFTENDWSRIGRITTSGTITEYPIPGAKAGPSGISAGPNGTISFSEVATNQIGTAPACGLGLRASYTSGTLSLSFDIGVTKAAQWAAVVKTQTGSNHLFNKTIPAVVPPKPLNLTFKTPLAGMVEVQSTLNDTNGVFLCGESQTLTIQ